jgi:Spy/CpxP family protein refolding chaperone
MTKQRWMVVALLLSVAFNFTFLGAFGYRMWVKHRHRAERGQRIEEPLPLPGGPGPDLPFEFRMEQREHFRHMRDLFLPEVGKTREQMLHKRRELADQIMSDKPDTQAVNGKLEEIGGLQMKIEKEVVRQMLKERELMDPAQRKQFQKFILKRFDDRDRRIKQRRMREEKKDVKRKP